MPLCLEHHAKIVLGVSLFLPGRLCGTNMMKQVIAFMRGGDLEWMP